MSSSTNGPVRVAAATPFNSGSPSLVRIRLENGPEILGHEKKTGPFQSPLKLGVKTYFVDPADMKRNPIKAFGPQSRAGSSSPRMPDAPGGIGF